MNDRSIYSLPEHQLQMEKMIDVDGWILDLGGGGEGIIGLLGGQQVVAIDYRLDELQETNNEALKLTMDARDLQFVDESFAMATAFFTLMYIEQQDRETVMREVHRVLKPGCDFHLWDVMIPPHNEGFPELIAIPLNITLPNGDTISTGYGTKWKGKEHDLAYYKDLAQQVGFEVIDASSDAEVFSLILRK